MPLDLIEYGSVSGGGGTPPLPPLYGLGNVDADTYLSSSPAGGITGSGGGFYVTSVFACNSVTNGDYIFSSAPPNAGWVLGISLGQVSFSCADPFAVYIRSPGYTPTVGEVIAAVGVYNFFDGGVKLYIQGQQIGAGTVTAGYSSTIGPCFVGGAGGANSYLNWHGCSYGLGIPSDADISDWYSTLMRTRSVPDFASWPSKFIWRPLSSGANPTSTGTGVASVLAKAGTGFVTLTNRNPDWA